MSLIDPILHEVFDKRFDDNIPKELSIADVISIERNDKENLKRYTNFFIYGYLKGYNKGIEEMRSRK